MEKTYTREELAEKARRTMAKQGLTEVYATEDGQLFYEKNRAELHANNDKNNVMKVFSYEATKKSKTKE
ncbi:hypothetical protein [Capnocytophaga sp.]|uniref:hypothetical protein n=1 Tax=Capnocytophaga sp. TaxID=44737 RepID=UPI0026DB7D05|nr:hypothetical protein [Capnocytophaga sp.]MDO5106223.1 hypothetical protein [Capnocytophaga sp.]